MFLVFNFKLTLINSNFERILINNEEYKGEWISGTGILLSPDGEEYKNWYTKIFSRDKFMPKIFKIHDYNSAEGLSQNHLDIMINNGSGLVEFIKGDTC